MVAYLPVHNSGNKTNMTFKFWNCIMCSDYFVQKPEVVFRMEHPHLFGSHPAWLYQAAVCQKCHRSLTTSKQGSLSTSSPKVLLPPVVDSTNENHQQTSSLPKVLISKNAPIASDNTIVSSSSSNCNNKEQFKNAAKVLFDCYICSKPVYENSRQGKLRRSKFPTLFSKLPEGIGVQKVCSLCCERLTRQRDRFVHAGISEEDRDYAAHIKIWTGQDFCSKMALCGAKNGDSFTCFVCEKYIPDNTEQDVRTLNRNLFPSIFSLAPVKVMKLWTCNSCHRKLLKVKSRFDEDNTEEEERDYWVFINSWRDKKGLEKHVYSNFFP